MYFQKLKIRVALPNHVQSVWALLNIVPKVGRMASVVETADAFQFISKLSCLMKPSTYGCLIIRKFYFTR